MPPNGVILARKTASNRKLAWIAALLVMPFFGVVAAFGIAPDTLDEKVRFERVVQEISLPVLQTSESPDASYAREARIARGDTVAGLLARLNVDDPGAAQFLRQSKETRAFNQLRPGRTVRARTSEDGGLIGLEYLTPAGNLLTVERAGEAFTVSEQPAVLERQLLMKSGEIRSSLFAATDAAGLPDSVAIQIADVFSSDIDFHRDLRRGDRFAVVYEAFYHQGEQVRFGRVVAAEFINQNRELRAVWFETADGQGGYYTPDGKNLRKAFLRSPLEFTRISSGFSIARFHPILQSWRAHRGIDYAAPTGTRVRATGDGVIARAGRDGAYGNLVVVNHAGRFSTYYAHLSGFAPGIRQGARVAQGDIVGYVGQTGLATGPHLHYEFHINGVQHDPLRVVLPEAPPITQALKPAFDAHAGPLADRLAMLRTVTLTARFD